MVTRLSANDTAGVKDAEARIRALTREAGSLREELRREEKRRERAVAQARMNEEQRIEADAKIQELQYSNKKLAAELASAHEAARVASERNRRGLRALREGLASVEDAVSMRATQGRQLISSTCQSLAKFKQYLSDQNLPPGLEIQATLTLGEVMKSMEQLEDILVSGAGRSEDVVDSREGDRSGRSVNPHQDLKKAELEAEIAHLKSQAEVLKNSAEQASTAAAAAAEAANAAASAVDKAGLHQHQQQVAIDAVHAVDVAADMARMGLELQQARHECEMLQAQVAELQERLGQSEKASLILRSFIDDVQSSGMQADQRSSELERQLTAAHLNKDALEREVASLHRQLADQRQATEEAGRKLSALQGTLSSQNEDMRNALMLISESHKEAGRAAKKAPLTLPTSVPTFHAPVPRIQMPYVHVPPPASFSPLPSAPAAPSPSFIPQGPPPALVRPPAPTTLPQSYPPTSLSTLTLKPSVQPTPPQLPSQQHYADASRDAAATALLAARVAAAAAVNSNSTRNVSSCPPPPPPHMLKEVSNISLLQPSISSQGPTSSLSAPAHPQLERKDEELRRRNQMLEMQELDSEIMQLEKMLKKAASGLL